MKTRTYKKRPPKTARAARRAWDYISGIFPQRRIQTLQYLPKALVWYAVMEIKSCGLTCVCEVMPEEIRDYL